VVNIRVDERKFSCDRGHAFWVFGNRLIKIAENAEQMGQRMNGTEEGTEVLNIIVVNVGIGALFMEEHPMLLGCNAGVAAILGALTGLVGCDECVEALVACVKGDTCPPTVGIGMGGSDTAEKGTGEDLKNSAGFVEAVGREGGVGKNRLGVSIYFFSSRNNGVPEVGITLGNA